MLAPNRITPGTVARFCLPALRRILIAVGRLKFYPAGKGSSSFLVNECDEARLRRLAFPDSMPALIPYRSVLIFLLLLPFSFPVLAFGADNAAYPFLHKTVFGLFLHDQGPASDRHESGIDPNWEIQFNTPDWKVWRWIGSPNPIMGVTPNFNGDTSVFYGGLNYEFSLSNRFTDELTYKLTKNLFVAGSLNLALHNGPLHKNKRGCEERSDCGFGYRALPRVAAEFGTKLWGDYGLSVFYDHMSHKGILPGENEGIDHVGVRFHYTFGNSRP